MLTTCVPALLLFATTPQKPLPPTRAGILELAKRIQVQGERKLDPKSRSALFSVQSQIKALKTSPAGHAQAIHELVSQLSFALATQRATPEAIQVTAAWLVQEAPEGSRCAALLGACMQAALRHEDAATALGYALNLEPGDTWAMLNLAHVLIDLGREGEAKLLLDLVVQKEPENKDAWRALAAYHFARRDKVNWGKALVKASTFSGFAQRKYREDLHALEQNKVTEEEPLSASAQKTRALGRLRPMSTADLLEEAFPEAAKQIRAHVNDLGIHERCHLPRYPMGKTNSAQDFMYFRPLVDAWVGAFGQNLQRFEMERMGVKLTGKETEEELQARGEEIAGEATAKLMEEQLRKLNQSEALFKQMGGSSKQVQQAMAMARREMEKVSPKAKAKVAQAEPPVPCRSLVEPVNYGAYLELSQAYWIYLQKLMEKEDADLQEIGRVYTQKAAELKASQEKELAHFHGTDPDRSPCKTNHYPCLPMRKKHRMARNGLADDHYKLWINAYLPWLTQRAKPALDEWWDVSARYIRGFETEHRCWDEYVRLRQAWNVQAMRAVRMALPPCDFPYEDGNLEDEEEIQAKIDAALEKAEEDARAKKEKFLKDTETPTFDWMKWLERNLSLDLSMEFIGLKVGPGTIELKFWVFGPAASVKWDMVNDVVETHVGLEAKAEFGLKVCGVGLKVETEAKASGRTTRFDLDKGTVTSTYDDFEVDAKVSAGGGSVGLSATAHPVTGKVTYKGSGEYKLGDVKLDGSIKYDSEKGTTTGTVGAGRGAFKGSATATVDPVTRSVKFDSSLGASTKEKGDAGSMKAGGKNLLGW